MLLEDSLIGSIFSAGSGQQEQIADAKQIKLMMQDEASYSLPAKQATTMIKIMDMPYMESLGPFIREKISRGLLWPRLT